MTFKGMKSIPQQKYASLRALSLNGFQAQTCTVEAVIRTGIPDFRITGMSRGGALQCAERVRAAIRSAGVRFPYSRVLVNLAPADLEKRGGYFDLAIAAAVLRAMHDGAPPGLLGEIDPRHTLLLGELTLSGRILPPDLLTSFLLRGREAGFQNILLAGEAIDSGRLIPGLEYLTADHLSDLLQPAQRRRRYVPGASIPPAKPDTPPAMRLSEHQRRALLICAAGRHAMLLIGPPGCGKTMLARLVPDLLPAPDENEKLEIIAVREMLGHDYAGVSASEAGVPGRPFRIPHHTSTIRALIGGGVRAEPGEATRAHRGVLFLDELAEFSRSALQALREPLQDGVVRLSRGAASSMLPADFLFLAATNPCPCGNFGNPGVRCDCPEHRRRGYLGRITGPLRDRIALEVSMYPNRRPGALRAMTLETWSGMMDQVERIRRVQSERYAGRGFRFNGEVPPEQLRAAPEFGTHSAGTCRGAEWEKLTGDFSARGRADVVRVARTIADLREGEAPTSEDVSEALSYVFPDAYEYK